MISRTEKRRRWAEACITGESVPWRDVPVRYLLLALLVPSLVVVWLVALALLLAMLVT